jgi:hypothetical protein
VDLHWDTSSQEVDHEWATENPVVSSSSPTMTTTIYLSHQIITPAAFQQARYSISGSVLIRESSC